MEYNTNDLSKILNLSTNTIRRYEEKGFLSSVRDDSNGYRKFGSSDVEKLMYINKYRKIGFSQEEILGMFNDNIDNTIERYGEKMQELDDEIARLTAFRHMLKDDYLLLGRVKPFGDNMIEMIGSGMHFVLYQKNGNLNLGKENSDALHNFMETCPEFEYIYHFAKEDVEAQNLNYSEGIAANTRITDRYNVNTQFPVCEFSKQFCIMKFVRVPLDIQGEELMTRKDISHILFGQFLDYMSEHNYKLAGDVLGLKLCLSNEDGKEWQYLLMHYPIVEPEGVKHL